MRRWSCTAGAAPVRAVRIIEVSTGLCPDPEAARSRSHSVRSHPSRRSGRAEVMEDLVAAQARARGLCVGAPHGQPRGPSPWRLPAGSATGSGALGRDVPRRAVRRAPRGDQGVHRTCRRTLVRRAVQVVAGASRFRHHTHPRRGIGRGGGQFYVRMELLRMDPSEHCRAPEQLLPLRRGLELVRQAARSWCSRTAKASYTGTSSPRTCSAAVPARRGPSTPQGRGLGADATHGSGMTVVGDRAVGRGGTCRRRL